MKSVSVAMASYNGARFINEQIETILNQLEENDELIISDDGSKDDTKDIIRRYEKEDNRVKLVVGPQKGVVANFENALKNTKNEIIMLADQDDVWMPNKISFLRQYFENHSNVTLLMHDMYDASNEDIEKKFLSVTSFSKRRRKNGFLYNTIYNGYYGCCMAFKRELLNVLLPFPAYNMPHDQWISLIAEYKKETVFIDKPLIIHRKHGNNVSHHCGISEQVNTRYKTLKAVYVTLKREKKRLR